MVQPDGGNRFQSLIKSIGIPRKNLGESPEALEERAGHARADSKGENPAEEIKDTKGRPRPKSGDLEVRGMVNKEFTSKITK